MRHAICYVSNVNPELKIQQIQELLKYCEKTNGSLNIKGILLFSEGNFFQVLEGEKEVVLPIWKQIELDTRHSGIIQVIGRDIVKGSLDGYKAEILSDKKKFTPGLPQEYTEPLMGMSPKIQSIIGRMMENFIITRS